MPTTDEETLERINDIMLARKAGRIELGDVYQEIWDALEHSEFWER